MDPLRTEEAAADVAARRGDQAELPDERQLRRIDDPLPRPRTHVSRADRHRDHQHPAHQFVGSLLQRPAVGMTKPGQRKPDAAAMLRDVQRGTESTSAPGHYDQLRFNVQAGWPQTADERGSARPKRNELLEPSSRTSSSLQP